MKVQPLNHNEIMDEETNQKEGNPSKKFKGNFPHENVEEMKVPPLNPMAFYPCFQHITEEIFKYLEKKSLKNCREVAKSWQNCLDDQNILWNKLVKHDGGNKDFQLACKNGHYKMAEILVQKSVELNIDLNATDKYGMSALHFACRYGHSKIAEMFVQKSVKLNIDLNATNKYGMSPFHFACRYGYSKIAEMFVQKSIELNIDLNATVFVAMMIDNAEYFKLDLNGFVIAKRNGKNKVENLIKKKMPSIAF